MSNPILRGFNPDPSICRVGDDYYIATSTFEWYPGVQIHHSRDLRNWRLIARPLNEARLLDMVGIPDSCGVWAPCLTYADNLFWLVYTNTRRFDGNFKDTPNYLTTAPAISGPWSDPVYLNSSGFDPSLFHDDDGRKWLVNMVWDHRPDRSFFGGINLQEYSIHERQLVGAPRAIFAGTTHDGTEGPHLYKRDGYYFLVCAEGGTGYDHAITVARASDIAGPYSADNHGHLITAKDDRDHPLQRAGHGSIVETPEGDLFTTFLCSRPIMPQRRSPMGRETGLQRITFKDGWFRTFSLDPRPDATGANQPRNERIEYEFTPDGLPLDLQWLRAPDPSELFSLRERPGYLRLFGRDSIGSTFYQSLVARRQTELAYSAEVQIDFEPNDFQQMAGLITYYNGHKFHYLYISHDAQLGRHVGIMSCTGDQSMAVVFADWAERTPLAPGPVSLSVRVESARQQFFLEQHGSVQPIGPVLDASLLSDEAGKGEGANFTGNFVGMAAQDLSGRRFPADFQRFRYSTGSNE